ncbi:MAG: hypothetical protein E7461_00600 [Ruminococcaceae bacterium]|nr:hypothetical protein [Oscillospiraceae bacterium]
MFLVIMVSFTAVSALASFTGFLDNFGTSTKPPAEDPFIVESASFLTFRFKDELSCPDLANYGDAAPVSVYIGEEYFHTVQFDTAEDGSFTVTFVGSESVEAYSSKSGWLMDKYRNVKIADPTESPAVLQEWLMLSADPVLKEISGTWEFNTTIDTSMLLDGYYLNFPFYVKKHYFTGFQLHPGTLVYANDLGGWTMYDTTWADDETRRMTFDGTVKVPVEWYAFVIANAHRVS